ncbi:MAG: hypothetical protein L3J63_06050, partial [Geopsychrobacter sp.]|nr:hypothetical protein [Geopsychrobacter sp.]
MSRHRSVIVPVSRTVVLGIAVLMGMVMLTLPQVARAKMAAQEHKSHHPGAAESDVAAPSGSGMGMGAEGGKSSGMGGQKAGGMGKGMKGMRGMMQAMARPKSTELFPLL